MLCAALFLISAFSFQHFSFCQSVALASFSGPRKFKVLSSRFKVRGSALDVGCSMFDVPSTVFELDCELHAAAPGEVVGDKVNPPQGFLFGMREEKPVGQVGDFPAPGQPLHNGRVLCHEGPQCRSTRPRPGRQGTTYPAQYEAPGRQGSAACLLQEARCCRMKRHQQLVVPSCP